MAELRPCPFGCKAGLTVYQSLDCEYVICDRCESTGPAAKTRDEAIAAWNRRATDGQRAGVPELLALLRNGGTTSGGRIWYPERKLRAMLAAAPTPDIGMTISPTPPAGDAGQERDRRDAKRYRYLRDECDLSVRDVFGSWCPHLNDGMDIAIDAAIAASKPQCDCLTCIRERGDTIDGLPRELCEMIVCTTRGNKQCPKANDHRNACTGSNEPGQPGSAYPDIAASKGEKG